VCMLLFLVPLLRTPGRSSRSVRLGISGGGPERWHVEVPATFGTLAEQASRSLAAAAVEHRRLLAWALTPELDPGSEYYRASELTAFASALAQPLLSSPSLPPGKRAKLLFSSPDEAAIASRAGLPVGVLGPSALDSADGAYVCVFPSAAATTALQGLLDEAGDRPVVVLNPQLDESDPRAAALLRSLEPCYCMRPLSVGYLRDQFAGQITRRRACVLRCFPHEYAVLLQDASDGWRYVGEFADAPSETALQALLQESLTAERNDAWRPEPGGGENADGLIDV